MNWIIVEESPSHVVYDTTMYRNWYYDYDKMKSYDNITCEEMLDVVKKVFDVSSAKEKRHEYVVFIILCGFPLEIHICKADPKVWRVFDPTDAAWDIKLMAVHAINDELDRHYY